MDGEKLSQDLNYLVFSWESKYVRNDKVFKEKITPIKEYNWDSEKAEQDEDIVSPIINRHIQEIEEEIQRINKENEDKRRKEEEERKNKERKEREKREQEELRLKKEQEELRLKKEKEQEELRLKNEQEELRLKKEKEQEEERQKAQEEAKRKEFNLSQDYPKNEANFETQGKAYIEKISNYQNSSEYKEIISSTESSIKSTRMNVKKTIQLSINQISSTHQQILSSSKRIKELLSGLRSSSTSITSSDTQSPMYSYGLYMAASLFIDQCWTQISAFPDSVWSYAYSCVYILDENDEFEAFLEGLMLTECRVLYSSNLEDLNKKENETEENFGKRLNSIVRFYLSINILRGNFGKIWLWLVKLLNKKSPHRLFVFVVLAVTQIVPHFFFSQFKNQFKKIIDYILRFKLPQIYTLIEGNPFPIKGQCKQLETILSDLKSSCNAPPPSGFILKDKHLDVEC
ncbi:GLE1-like protein [Cryptosporidium tyzzeri]|nr:GLE1-like protein [Cryptosporidium tyzzeri]